MRDPTKQPIIRSGQRTPYRKATRQQIAQRIESARLLLFCGFDKSRIHRVFRGFMESSGDKTTGIWLARARGNERFAAFFPRNNGVCGL